MVITTQSGVVRSRGHRGENNDDDHEEDTDLNPRLRRDAKAGVRAVCFAVGLTLLGAGIGYVSIKSILANRSEARRSRRDRDGINKMNSAAAPRKAGTSSSLYLGPLDATPLLKPHHPPADRVSAHQKSAGTNVCNEVEYFAPVPLGMSEADFAFLPSYAPTPLSENVTVRGAVPLSAYHYYQLCVASHPAHHHRVTLTLATPDLDPAHATKARAYNADLYLSVDDPHPTVDRNTWISADVGLTDTISVSTYLEDFAAAPATASGKGKVLFVGVFGRSASKFGVEDPDAEEVPYSLTVTISNVEQKVLLKRSKLRGGAVVRTGDSKRVV